jgi:hypothetical protein
MLVVHLEVSWPFDPRAAAQAASGGRHPVCQARGVLQTWLILPSLLLWLAA